MRARDVAGSLERRARGLWNLARHEHATPKGIGLSVAIGVFCGCTPAIGFHIWLALGLATLLRLNRLWALLGSKTCFFLLLPWIALAEVESAHRLRTGAWAPVRIETIFVDAHGLIVDWLVGTLLVGGFLATLLGSIAYLIASRANAKASVAEADLGPSGDHPVPLAPPPPGPDPARWT